MATMQHCDYQQGTIECRGDGYCWDADHDGYDPDDHSYPCPQCNTKEYLEDAKEYAESTSEGGFNGHSWTGADYWRDGVKHARRWNSKETRKALASFGVVRALIPANNKNGYKIVRFTYTA